MTYCQYINYWHDYSHYLVYPFKEGMYVPWVTRVEYRFAFECKDFKLPSDPTRRYVLPAHEVKVKAPDGKEQVQKIYDVQPHVFAWNDLKMHHLSWIRANIRKKLNDWSSKKCFEGWEELIDKSVYRYDRFNDENINEPAELLFNTPGHKVNIAKFPKQYIHPKVDIKTRLRPTYQPKKVLVLVLSCSVEPFQTYDRVIQETWARDIVSGKWPNVEFWIYKHKEGITETEVDEEHHTIWTVTKDDLSLTFPKWQEVMKLFKERGGKWDWVLRMNSSTWCNFEAVEKFVGHLDNDRTNYAGALYTAWWTFHRLYLSGNSLLINWADAMVTLDEKWVPKYIVEQGIIDDVAISAAIFNRYIKIGVDYTERFKSLGIQYELEKDKVDESQDWRDKFMHTFFITTKNVKEDERDLDISETPDFYKVISKNRDFEMKKMERIQEIYDSMHFNEDDIEQMRKNVIESEDSQIYFLNCTKNEQMTEKVNVENWQYDSKNIIKKEEIIKLQRELEERDRANRT